MDTRTYVPLGYYSNTSPIMDRVFITVFPRGNMTSYLCISTNQNVKIPHTRGDGLDLSNHWCLQTSWWTTKTIVFVCICCCVVYLSFVVVFYIYLFVVVVCISRCILHLLHLLYSNLYCRCVLHLPLCFTHICCCDLYLLLCFVFTVVFHIRCVLHLLL